MEKPLLSVCIRAYNQDAYIAQTIDGVLMQKTTFPFEIIIGDDCSTDHTPLILADYATRYPELIRIITNDINIGGTKNLRKLIESSEATYIALCDGDDYWIDPYKLQKQVDFLSNHPEYVVCFHNVINCWENIQKKPTLFNPLDFPTHHTYQSLVERDWFLPINGEVFVRRYLFFPDWYDTVMNDDYVINLVLALNGFLYYMPDLMAVYRHNANSESNLYSNFTLINNNLRQILIEMKRLYPIECSEVFDRRINEYNMKINFLQLEKKYPFRKYLRIKTYRKIIKKHLNIGRIQ